MWQARAFASPSLSACTSLSCVYLKSQSDAALDLEDALFLERFKRRRHEISSLKSEKTPKQLVETILSTLLTPHNPSSNWGYEYLYTYSTERWQHILRKSVGLHNNTEEDLIYEALAGSMERDNQQFGILVGMGVDDGTASCLDQNMIDNNMNSMQEEYYTVEYPYDTLDYQDGTAWIECRLRNIDTDTLLVVIGWSLQQVQGEWKVDGIDWQDFREKYRPGIGREEWERICG